MAIDTDATLRLLDKRLATAIRKLNPPARRAFAVEVAELAMDRAGLTDGRVRAAHMAAVKGDAARVATYRAEVEAAVKRLDDEAHDADERAGGSSASPEYIATFNLARAANAVLAALDADTLVAAVQAAYEATKGVEIDADDVRAIADKHTTR